MHKRVRRKLALGRGSVSDPAFLSNERWSLNFEHNDLQSRRRSRILAVGDDCTRENLALEADFAFSGARIARTLDAIAEMCGYPKTIVMDNDKASPALLRTRKISFDAKKRPQSHLASLNLKWHEN